MFVYYKVEYMSYVFRKQKPLELLILILKMDYICLKYVSFQNKIIIIFIICYYVINYFVYF